jgi:hypothetical protein
MANDFVSLRFDKGLVTQFETSVRDPQSLAELVNWIADPTGGLRARIGWLNAGRAGVPDTAKARGIGYFAKGTPRFLVAHNDSVQYGIYRVDKGNLAAGFTLLESNAVASTSRLVSFAAGLDNILWCTEDYALVRRWDGSTLASVTGSKPGRFIVFHHNRFFTSQGTRLWYMDLGALTTGVNNYIDDFDKDDGEPLEAAVPFDQGLVIGKANSLWFLTGRGPDTFGVHRLNGGGCAPGNTLVATPYGVVVVGREQVWLWQGGSPLLISRSIEDDYGMTGAFMSAAYLDDVVFIADEGSGKTWAYNLLQQAWRTEEMEMANEAPCVFLAQGDYLLGGPKAATVGSLLWYRQHPTGQRAKDPDTLSETFRASTQEIWIAGNASTSSVLHMHLRIRQRGGDSAQSPLAVTPYFDGHRGRPQLITPKEEAGVFRHRLDFEAQAAYGVRFDMEQVVLSGESAVMEIESAELEIQVEAAL